MQDILKHLLSKSKIMGWLICDYIWYVVNRHGMPISEARCCLYYLLARSSQVAFIRVKGKTVDFCINHNSLYQSLL